MSKIIYLVFFFNLVFLVESNLFGEISDFPPNFSSNVYNFSHIHADV